MIKYPKTYQLGKKFSEISTKKALSIIISVLLFFVFNDRIVSIIEKYFFIKNDISSLGFDILIIGLTLSLIIYSSIRLYYTRYKLDFFATYLCLSISAILIYYLIKAESLKWEFLKDSVLNLYYVIYILIPLLALFIYSITMKYIAFFKKETVFKSKFHNDDPISKSISDQLEYSPYVNNLSKILLEESFGQSFSIALVGPWGNGKSSILNMVRDEMNYRIDMPSSILIEFLPYLNHKEDDIINEFFVLLSNKLSKFNGKISNQILDYSQKINDLYQNQNFLNFGKNKNTFKDNLSAKELYDNINSGLKEINKKIVVFIDDLDRLSGNEISEVLKLIRNTANFTNTIFVVAMDKDYVLQRLKQSGEVLSTAYLDKFFQFEIYLPEIEKSVLRTYFIEAFEDDTSEFKKALNEALEDNNVLFDNYIKNLRDVKKYVNQIKFDYPFVKNEIDLSDFINFTFLKIKFPYVINLINKNRLNLFKFNRTQGTYSLEEIEEDKNNNETDYFYASETIESNDLEKFKSFKVFKEIIKNKQDIFQSNLANGDEQYLLIATLIKIFGSEDAKNQKSIQLKENLNIILQRKIHDDIFTQTDYDNLLSFRNLEELKIIFAELNNRKKINQFLKNLQWFEPSDLAELKKMIIILFRLYELKINYSLNSYEISQKLNYNIAKLSSIDSANKKENTQWLWGKILSDEILSVQNQILLLGDIWDKQVLNNFWGFSKNNLKLKVVEKYKIYLSLFNNKLWDISDFNFYYVYHAIKNIDGVQEVINTDFQEFWRIRNIELLCAQTIESPAFSNSRFILSDFILDVFNNKSSFIEFICEHINHGDDWMKEYFEFLLLLEKTQFQFPLDYKFKKSDLIKKRVKNIEKNYKRQSSFDEIDGACIVLIESNDDELFRKYLSYGKDKFNFKFIEHEGFGIMKIEIRENRFEKDLIELGEDISKFVRNFGWGDSFDKSKLLNNDKFIVNPVEKHKYFKVIYPKIK